MIDSFFLWNMIPGPCTTMTTNEDNKTGLFNTKTLKNSLNFMTIWFVFTVTTEWFSKTREIYFSVVHFITLSTLYCTHILLDFFCVFGALHFSLITL